MIVQGWGVQVLGEPLIIENGHGAQAVNGEIQATTRVAQDSEQEIDAHRQEGQDGNNAPHRGFGFGSGHVVSLL